jgi:hypothetical protein
VNKLEYNKVILKKQVQLKIKGKRGLVDKNWPGCDQSNWPNHQNQPNHAQNLSGQKGQSQKTQNRAKELLSKKITLYDNN